MLDTNAIFKFTDNLISLIFIGSSASVLVAKYNTKLRGFLKYGKTLDIKQLHSFQGNQALNRLLMLQIPKVWFAHFYLLSLVLSSLCFTLMQLTIKGRQFFIIDVLQKSHYGEIPLEVSRLVMFLILGHSLRRLSETLLMMNYYNNKSKMNISHYLVGILFYTSINLQLMLNTDFNDKSLSETEYPVENIQISIIGPVLLFYLASSSQFLNHLHLSKLVKYTIPSFGMFRIVCCAHYLDEILIYISIFLLLKNITSFLALAWVIINLSVSSMETRKYYKKNSDGKVAKWCIIPLVL